MMVSFDIEVVLFAAARLRFVPKTQDSE